MFGELVCGPPGSGKTTYCEGKRQFLSVYDPARPITIVNLDPANEGIFPYPCDVDIRELVSHSIVMREENLGPNGSYLFCAEVMERGVDWVIENVEKAVQRRVQEVVDSHVGIPSMQASASLRPPYLLIDCPGQVEFYLNSSFMHTLTKAVQKRLRCTLCTVHLVDAGIATRDLPTYVSACLLSLTTMIDHELPHVNLLTKWDTVVSDELGESLEDGSAFLFASDFTTENFDRLWRRQLRQKRRHQRMADYCVTTQHPVPSLDAVDLVADEAIDSIDLQKDGGRIYKFTKTLMDVIEGYGLVGYLSLDIHNQEMMLRVTQEIDNALGNFF